MAELGNNDPSEAAVETQTVYILQKGIKNSSFIFFGLFFNHMKPNYNNRFNFSFKLNFLSNCNCSNSILPYLCTSISLILPYPCTSISLILPYLCTSISLILPYLCTSISLGKRRVNSQVQETIVEKHC